MPSKSFLNYIFSDGGYNAYILLIIVLAYFTNQYDMYVYTVSKIPFLDYNSYEYVLIAGPIFTIMFTTAGVFIGFFSQTHNRVLLIAGGMVFWGITVALVSISTTFWQVALLRAGLGLGQSAFIPLSTSVLGDYFPMEMRATSLGVFNIGIYAGYGFSLGFGTLIENMLDWRWSYVIAGAMPAAIALLMVLTVKEPGKPKTTDMGSVPEKERRTHQASLSSILGYWCSRPSLLILCLAGGIRNAGGYCWGSFTALFFSDYFQSMPAQRQTCLYSYNGDYFDAQVCSEAFPFCVHGKCSTISANPWHDIGLSPEKFETFIILIPLIAGSLGAVLGGAVSDRVAKGRSVSFRLLVVMFSNVVAAPFAVGVLLAPYPWCFICLIGAYVFGEMWIGVLLTLIIELVPKQMSATSIAVYIFIITNIGGNAPLLVPFFKQIFDEDHTYFFYASPMIETNSAVTEAEFTVTKLGAKGLTDSLLLMYPGVYALSSLFFAVAFCFLERDLKAARAAEKLEAEDEAALQPLLSNCGIVKPTV